MNENWGRGLRSCAIAIVSILAEGNLKSSWGLADTPIQIAKSPKSSPNLNFPSLDIERSPALPVSKTLISPSETERTRIPSTPSSLAHFEDSLDELERAASDRELVQVPESNEDRFLQPSPDLERLPLPESPPTVPPPPQTPSEANPEPIVVRNLVISGSTVFAPRDFADILETLPSFPVTLSRGDLEQLAEKVTERYWEYGYVNSRAIVKEESLASGEIEIQIIEGSVEQIDIEGTQRLNRNYIRDRVVLGVRKPLNTIELEEQLRLLRADPLLENIEASLSEGSAIDTSILIVRVIEAQSFGGEIGADNTSPPSVGSERLKLELKTLNLSGVGDRAEIEYKRTTQGGFESIEANYAIPLNPRNGTLQVRTALQNNTVDVAASNKIAPNQQ